MMTPEMEETRLPKDEALRSVEDASFLPIRRRVRVFEWPCHSSDAPIGDRMYNKMLHSLTPSR
ncbi:hypothetical protein OUZ56_019194 [Daphnia magna]|uniref:Uncharacterized protein n=1 Tax=Daphnia magna TaxID=35525 RepID=A0ABQ9ZAX7_9CRUS|nr:hypothetical protein OUZ56_019194 [Daphnia magna]